MPTPHFDHYVGCADASVSGPTSIMTAEGAQPYQTPPEITGLPPVDQYKKPQSGPELQRKQRAAFVTTIGSLASRSVCSVPVRNDLSDQPSPLKPASPYWERLQDADWR